MKHRILLTILSVLLYNIIYSQITDVQVLSKAQTYIHHPWTANANNIWDDVSCGGKTVNTPAWVEAGSTYSYIPYCWGGFSTLDVFDSNLAQGKSAGDNNTTGGGAEPTCAVGVDCSGFVSQCYGLSQHYSTAMINVTSSVFGHHNSYNDLRDGDIVNYPSHHVRLVKHINDNGTYSIIEAAAGSGLWRVFERTYNLSDLSAHYLPQYLNDMVVTTGNLDCSNAIALTCGVSYHGESSSAPSNVESYGCNNWSESGPERVHTITPSASGTITATVSNDTGSDLDVYILGDCSPASCLGEVFSDYAIYDNAIAGETYYIVVDADDGSGSAYDIIVDCPTGIPDLQFSAVDIDDGPYGNSSGDNDGKCESGEQIEIPIELLNSGNAAATGIHANLSVTDPDITILNNNLYWADMNPNDRKWSYGAYFSISDDCPDKDVLFTLDITSNEGSWTQTFTIHMYNTVSVEEIEPNKKITVFPNPTDGIINFETENVEIQHVDVYNINGKVILSADKPEKKSVDLRNFPGGIYFIRFTDSKSDSKIFKIIKN